MARKWRKYWFLVLLWHKNEWIFVKTPWVHLYTFRYTYIIRNLYIVIYLRLTERLVNDLLKITQQHFRYFVEHLYMPSEHLQKAIYISKLSMQLTFSNMCQNDNVTNDLIHGRVNDHGFEDTAMSRVKTNIYHFLKQFRIL